VAADPILDDQSGIVHKAGFVMGHKGHIQCNGMGCNALVQGVAVAILVSCANGTVSPGGLGSKGCDQNVCEQGDGGDHDIPHEALVESGADLARLVLVGRTRRTGAGLTARDSQPLLGGLL
jgi:hypothetical protein